MSADQDIPLTFGDFAIDRADERLIGPHGPVKLGNKAYRVLLLLAGQQGRLLTKDALFSSVWDGTIVGESALTSVIKELRRALGDESRTPRYIESVYGRGYRFIAPVDTGTPLRPAGRAADVEGKPPLVLVSAFHDEAIRARYPHCAAELREEVLSSLSRFREIQLVADSRPVADAEALYERASPRDYQLTATLLPDGDGVKVIARAKHLSDGRVVWAESMSLSDLGTAGGVETIVRRIAGAALPAVDEDVSLGLPPETRDYYDSYLIAKRRSFSARSFAEARAAAYALEGLIAERPEFGLAYPPLVRLYNTDFGYTALGSTGAEERLKGLNLAKAGLGADRGNVHAYTVLGFCYLWHDEIDLARGCFDRALALNPYNHVRLQEVAAGWMFLGDFGEAGSLMERASELHQVPDDNFYEDSGRLRLLEGRYDEARILLDQIAKGTIWADFYLALSERRLGDESGPVRLDRWLKQVRANWHATASPTDAEVGDWVKRHHPMVGGAGERFFSDVDEALGQAPGPQQGAVLQAHR